ncbi:glutamic acid-rich protein-like [Montipora capricornis]|uniref:glutamic acid-rich protein-like n=1 Tax=Montipora capricornis TaxID=246305 RepID=UPI0035F13E8E
MAGRNRKKKQGCVEEPKFLNRSKEDPWVLVRRLEARLAQEKFYHEKTKTESQYEIKTLQAKVKSLERQKKTYLEKLEQNPIEQQGKLEKELNETSKQLRETTQKLADDIDDDADIDDINDEADDDDDGGGGGGDDDDDVNDDDADIDDDDDDDDDNHQYQHYHHHRRHRHHPHHHHYRHHHNHHCRHQLNLYEGILLKGLRR